VNITGLFASPLFGLGLTLLVYAGAKRLYGRVRFFLLHPVLVSIAAIIAALKLLDIDYPTYMKGGGIVAFFLAPAVVALGLPLYRQLRRLASEALPLVLTTAFASAVGIVASVAPVLILGGPRELLASLAPKSVTTPIAIVVSEQIGGLPSLTAAAVVLTGVVGAVAGPVILRLIGITEGIAFGYAMGTASHGIGTARALEAGEVEGAASSLALCMNGIATAVLAPWIVRLLIGAA